MDRWPGAYPETPTPQQQQQEPQYPVYQQAQRHPHGGLTEQPTEAPPHHPGATEVKPHDSTGAQSHAGSTVGISNAEYHRLKSRTLDDERNPSVDEAVGGGTYARPGETFPTQTEGQPKRNVEHGQSGEAGWPLSNVAERHEQQPPKVHQYHPDGSQRVVQEVQEQQKTHDLPHQSSSVQSQSDNSLSHGHQPSDLPVAYQQHVRDVPQQAHQVSQHSQGVQQQPHAERGVAELTHGHGASNLPLAYQQNTLAQQPESSSQPARGVQQQQDNTLSQQPHEGSHSGAEKGLAAGVLAGAGMAAHDRSSRHEEIPQQHRDVHQQQGSSAMSQEHQPSDLPAAYQQHVRDVPQQAHQSHEQPQTTQQRPSGAEASSAFAHGGQPSTLPVSNQENTRSQQPPAADRDDESHPKAKQGVIASALAAVGLAGYSQADKHDEHTQQSRAQQQQPGAAAPEHDHHSSWLPATHQQDTRQAPHPPHDHAQPSHAAQQQPHAAAAHGLHRDHQPSHDSVAHQQTTQLQQHRSDHDHSKAEKDLAAGSLAGAGAAVAAHEHIGSHDESSRQSHAAQQQSHELRHETRDLSHQQHIADQRSARDSEPGTASHDQSGTSSTPPYWGSLPTAATGGIYNTVTGHGSARDDHDQHHSLSPKDRTVEEKPADATIPSAATSFPTGGVYNTVTGHGSNNEGDRHPDVGSRNEHDSGHSRVPLLGAGQSRHVQDTTGSNVPSGAESRNVQRTTESSGPLHGASTAPSHSHDSRIRPADRTTYGETGTQRAFPLATSDRDAHQNDQPHSNMERGLAAGALAGTGAAAYGYSGRHDQQVGRDTRDAHDLAGREQAPAHREQHTTPAETVSHQPRKLEKRTSPDDKHKHDSEHHGLFGLGGKHDKQDTRDVPAAEHRVAQQTTSHQRQAEEQHKEHHGGLLGGLASKHDMAEGRDPTAQHRADPSAHSAGTEHRLVESKPQAAAISPPNAEERHKEHHGLFHHGNDEGRSPRDIAPIPGTHPAENRAVAGQSQPISPANAEAQKRSSIDGRESPQKKEHQGLFGIFHRNKDDKKEEEPKQHRRSGSIERHNTLKKQPPPKVAQAMRESTPSNKNSIEQERHRATGTAEHDHRGALATGAGVAAGGVAASELAHRHADTQDASRHPGTAQPTSHGAGQSGAYQTLPSGTSSGVGSGTTGMSQHSSSTQHMSHAPQDSYSREASGAHSGQYNTLADGTPSGVATSRATQQTTTTSNVGAGQTGYAPEKSAQHDRFEQVGAASGIAAGAGAAGLYAASRDSRQPEQYDNTQSSTDMRAVDSGIQSRSAAPGSDWRSQLPPIVGTGSSTTPSAVHDRQASQPATSQVTGTTHDNHSHGHTTSRTGPYDTLESGTASSLATGAAAGTVGAAAPHGGSSSHATSQGIKEAAAPLTQGHHESGKGSDLPNPYNVLPSGTPSGVNIDYKRRSKELERQE